jgi:hypothetical protein
LKYWFYKGVIKWLFRHNNIYEKGQRVEVVLIAEDDDRSVRVDELRRLFKNTQALPQVQAISEDVIAEGVEKYRSER